MSDLNIQHIQQVEELKTSLNLPGGHKDDQLKLPITLIPMEAILGMAEVFKFGAEKYGKHNYRKGMDWSRLLDACFRHVIAFSQREDLDPETKLSHIYHALCCLAMLSYYYENSIGNDDRYAQEKN